MNNVLHFNKRTVFIEINRKNKSIKIKNIKEDKSFSTSFESK